jgi:Rrf2 family nitric oxide-sensitive transcriptional repressor
VPLLRFTLPDKGSQVQITQYTDYSIRVLIYLAVHGEELSTIAEIAHRYEISRNHLMKVVQELNARGYVQAIRGKNGGVRLRTSPSDINLGKLVRELEGGTSLLECFGRNNKCVITPSCQLRHAFAEALQSFYCTLEEYTLQDLLGHKAQVGLKKILFSDAA